MDLKEVTTAATRFRRALEAGKLNGVGLAQFPRGACGDSAELLGQYLRDCGQGEWTYVSGAILDPFQSHAWIERAGLIVDITADQFSDVCESVVVTSGRRWHDRFERMGGTHIAGLAYWSGPDLSVMRQDYKTLKLRADSGA